MISYQYKNNTYLIIAQLPRGSREALFKFSLCPKNATLGENFTHWAFLTVLLDYVLSQNIKLFGRF